MGKVVYIDSCEVDGGRKILLLFYQSAFIIAKIIFYTELSKQPRRDTKNHVADPQGFTDHSLGNDGHDQSLRRRAVRKRLADF